MILVYNDKGVGQLGLYSLLYKLRQHDKSFLIVNAHFIKNNDLSKFKALIIGGGADIPYCNRLGSVGIKKIQDFVKNGGNYIGICAGAYFACRQIEFTGRDYNVFDSRELALFDGVGIGSIAGLCHGVYYDETSASKAIVELSFGRHEQKAYYHGGCYFENALPHQMFAKYKQIDKPAVVLDNYGKGKYLLSGVHFEIEYTPYIEYINENKNAENDAKIDNELELRIIGKLKRIVDNKIFDYILKSVL